MGLGHEASMTAVDWGGRAISAPATPIPVGDTSTKENATR
jgi:hypothetical protein